MIDLINDAANARIDGSAASNELAERLARSLIERIDRAVVIDLGAAAAGHVCICFAGTNGEVLMELLRERGLLVATGSRCSSIERSLQLESLDVPYEYALGSIFFRLADTNTVNEIERAVEMLADAVADARRLSGYVD